MDNETIKSTEESVKYWIDIADKKGVDRGMNEDPLCVMFSDTFFCKGCPVDDAGFHGCLSISDSKNQSVYEVWEHLSTENSNFDRIAETPEAQKAARDMAEFLESLLPEKDKNGEQVD